MLLGVQVKLFKPLHYLDALLTYQFHRGLRGYFSRLPKIKLVLDLGVWFRIWAFRMDSSFVNSLQHPDFFPIRRASGFRV